MYLFGMLLLVVIKNIYVGALAPVVMKGKKMKNVMLGFCLIVLIGCGTSNAYQKPSVRIVGEAQMTKLPNGNYEVTPRWIKDRFNAENSMVKQLEDCREGGR